MNEIRGSVVPHLIEIAEIDRGTGEKILKKAYNMVANAKKKALREAREASAAANAGEQQNNGNIINFIRSLRECRAQLTQQQAITTQLQAQLQVQLHGGANAMQVPERDDINAMYVPQYGGAQYGYMKMN